jgi:hypothetical protein
LEDPALSPPASHGASQLLAYFIDAALESKRYFVAGPVWNQLDRMIAGDTQYLRYAFDGVDNREVPFSTTELERYGSDDAEMKQMLEKKVCGLLEKE